MDSTGIIILIGLVCLLALLVGWWLWQFLRIEDAKRWPSTEATIQSGAEETVSTPGRGLLRVPVLAFSYKVSEEYYSGQFVLVPNSEPSESLIKRVIDRKLKIRYNPRQPSSYFIPDVMIEGCEVKQKMDPHLIRIYPTD